MADRPEAVPTRVGVNPDRKGLDRRDASCPHSRGGEPVTGQYAFKTSKLSPLAWG